MNGGEHVALLREFLDRRQAIVEDIDTRVLNVRAKGGDLRQMLDSCFFGAPGLPRGLSRLHGQLAAAHLADGFEPIGIEGFAHELDPVELIVRAHRHWDRQRRPGKNLRLPYAARVYSVFILRQLEHLSLRIWDDGHDAAADRLDEIQGLLDRLNDPIPDALVRDARWLIQTAQGPLTRRLDPYFRTAARIPASFTATRRLEIHKAGALLTAGHLRSQLRHRAAELDRPADDPGVLTITRNSNSMDAALLVGDLVPLLEAYGAACAGDDAAERLDLADAIFQGVSADPELLLTRLDLLGPATMIEHLFIHGGEGAGPRSTPMGEAHRHLVDSYAGLIGRHAASLHDDAVALDPRQRAYSPLGIVYGFCADLLSNMALDTLLSRPSFGLSLEDMFASRVGLENKRARTQCWKAREQGGVRSPFDYAEAWAAQVFERTRNALRARAGHQDRANASALPDARLFVESAPEGAVVAQEHCVTSDLPRALATGATAFPKGQIVADRNEGRFLASAECEGKWFAVSKAVLTVCTSQGKHALVTGVPPSIVDTLRLTCPELVVIDPAGRAPGRTSDSE